MNEKGALAANDAQSASLVTNKLQDIIDACGTKDISALRRLAGSTGGYLNDELRSKAWPVILGVDRSDHVASTTNGAVRVVEKLNEHSVLTDEINNQWRTLPAHPDEEQVELDVHRAFVYYPQDETDATLTSRKTALSSLIISVLRTHPYLSYFQGYHDIAQVLLLTLPSFALQHACLTRLSLLRIRDFMLPNLHPAISQLHLIPDILHAADAKLWKHLSGTEPFFALSGTLTMYAHDVQNLGEIARLFDVLLAREPVFSVYMFAQIILDRREELFDTPADEPEMLHSILSKLPQPLGLEALISKTVALVDKYPPETLGAWRTISRHSVLKTGTSTEECARQTLEDGRRAFGAQVKELEWEKYQQEVLLSMKKYRTPAMAVGVAVLVGVTAVLMRRYGAVPASWR